MKLVSLEAQSSGELLGLLLTDTSRVFAVNMVIENINELLLVNEG